MRHGRDNVITHNIGLLDVAEDLGGVWKACQTMVYREASLVGSRWLSTMVALICRTFRSGRRESVFS